MARVKVNGVRQTASIGRTDARSGSSCVGSSVSVAVQGQGRRSSVGSNGPDSGKKKIVRRESTRCAQFSEVLGQFAAVNHSANKDYVMKVLEEPEHSVERFEKTAAFLRGLLQFGARLQQTSEEDMVRRLPRCASKLSKLAKFVCIDFLHAAQMDESGQLCQNHATKEALFAMKDVEITNLVLAFTRCRPDQAVSDFTGDLDFHQCFSQMLARVIRFGLLATAITTDRKGSVSYHGGVGCFELVSYDEASQQFHRKVHQEEQRFTHLRHKCDGITAEIPADVIVSNKGGWWLENNFSEELATLKSSKQVSLNVMYLFKSTGQQFTPACNIMQGDAAIQLCSERACAHWTKYQAICGLTAPRKARGAEPKKRKLVHNEEQEQELEDGAWRFKPGSRARILDDASRSGETRIIAAEDETPVGGSLTEAAPPPPPPPADDDDEV